MQGILIVDKPTDWTSFDVIAKLRGILGTRKLGHSGTLDPMATGVLPVFCGGASKAVDLQLDHTKAYRAVLRLGARTDTGDITGTVLTYVVLKRKVVFKTGISLLYILVFVKLAIDSMLCLHYQGDRDNLQTPVCTWMESEMENIYVSIGMVS